MKPDAERPSARTDAEVPRIGRYRVCYRIAQGGMASVYLARLEASSGFSKWVALKIIHPSIAAEPRFVEMFLDEARIAARLDHPNLCTVFDFGEDDGRYYLAMEYLHGETLGNVARRAWTAQGALPRELGVRLVADAARGLHHAHELEADDGAKAHVVHRDVSPENVFVTYSGTAKVVDFGVARADDQLHERTSTGELKGKLAYMSPEQLHERRVDRRTDVWSLGVVLWEVTVGRRLFRRQTDAATVFAITRDPITPPSRLVQDYPSDLEAIVMRALERDLTRRYQTAQELCRALESWLLTSGRPAGVTEVGEFMQALFADQIAWRDRFLRQHEQPFRDLVAQWQSTPLRASAGDNPDVPGLDLGLVARPSPSPARLSAEPPDPPPRIPLLDDPDATVRAPEVPPRDAAAIPLTRRAPLVTGRALGRRALTPPQAEDLAATRRRVAARAGTTPQPPRVREPQPGVTPAPVERATEPYIAPPRRSRWDVPFYLLGLMVLGGLFAHIAWFDKPTPRRPAARPSPPASTPRAPPTPPTAPPTAPRPAAPAPPVPTPPVLAPAAPPPAPAEAPRPRVRRHSDEVAEEVTDDDRSVPGLLRVTATAPAEVFIGSRSLGPTPLEGIALSPGVYSVRVVSSERAGARDFIVTVRPRRTATLHAEWADERAMPIAPSAPTTAP